MKNLIKLKGAVRKSELGLQFDGIGRGVGCISLNDGV